MASRTEALAALGRMRGRWSGGRGAGLSLYPEETMPTCPYCRREVDEGDLIRVTPREHGVMDPHDICPECFRIHVTEAPDLDEAGGARALERKALGLGECERCSDEEEEVVLRAPAVGPFAGLKLCPGCYDYAMRQLAQRN